jgi:ferric-dicitrate binding protein FerR (iron transport regulator)
MNKEKKMSLWKLWNLIDAQADESTYETLRSVNQRMDKLDYPLPKRTNYAYFLRIAGFILLPLLCTFLTYQITSRTLLSDAGMTECFVENGQKRQIVLPDGTEVWLNSGSWLLYPTQFQGNKREVFLNGEANFDVAKNPEKPFLVNTNYLIIQALGTKFNVQAYSGRPKTIATLEEGKVKVDTKTVPAESHILSPNEQLVYDNLTGQMTSQILDAAAVSLWKNGHLIFQNATLDEIFYTLSKHYNMQIQFDARKYDSRRITVRFSQNETLDEILNILHKIESDLNYTIKNNTIFIY